MSYKLLTNLLFEPRGKHNPSLTYNIKDTVMSEDGSKVYFALDNVPAGIPLTDTNYWMLQMDLSASKNAMDVAAANARTQTDATIASANTRVEDMMGKAAEAVTSVADYAAKVGMRVKGETKITKGNPMTIYPDGGSLLKVQTDIPIKQLGNGEPYPAGSRKNKFTGWIRGEKISSATGAIESASDAARTGYIPVMPSKQIEISGLTDTLYHFVVYYDKEKNFISRSGAVGNNAVTIRTPDNCAYIAITQYENANVTGTITDLKDTVQIEYGLSSTDYEHWENIRPFVGYNELELRHAGKNLCDISPFLSAWSTENADMLSLINTLAPGTYTVSVVFEMQNPERASATSKYGLYFYPYGDRVLVEWGSVAVGTTRRATYTFNVTADNAGKFTAAYFYGCGEDSIGYTGYATAKNVQIEFGSTATPYEPYKGTIHTVQLGKTTYQGHYDWLTGKFKAEWKGMRLLSSYVSTSMKYVSGYVGAWMDEVLVNDRSEGQETILCSHLLGRNVYNWSRDGVYVQGGNTIGIQFSGASIPGYTDTGNADQNAGLVRAYLDANDVRIAWKLATPIEIQLAPNVITAVEDGGVNHIYGDADLTVEWVKPLETSLTEHGNAKVDANNEALLMGVAQKERSVGNLVVINDAVANVAFPHVETVFPPKQSGSGDPYPGGGGKNLLDVAACIPSSSAKDRTVTINGEYITITTNAVTIPQAPLISFDEITLSPGVYTLVLTKALPGMVRTDGSELYVHPGKTFTTFNLSSEFTFSRLAIDLTEDTAVNETFGICIRADNVTDYVPYSNIRPITGYDAVELNHAGKNLLNNIRYYDSTHTDIRAQYDSPLLLKAGVKYVLSTNFKADGLFFVDAAGNGSLEAQYLIKYQYDISSLEYTPERDIECIFVAIFNSGVPDGATIQLEVGSDSTAYEPYQGTIHTVQLGETVYGGRYNWLTGMFVKTYVPFTEYGNMILNSSNYTGDGNIFYAYGDFVRNGAVSSTLANSTANPWEALSVNTMRVDDNYLIVCVPNSITTPRELAAYMEDQMIVYKLATPIEIQLDPTRITTIPGTNTIFGDGEFTIDWFKSYKKVAEEHENLLLDSFTDKAELSGNPIVMTPVGGIPFDSVVAEFTPKQAGSGDPYPAGGGNNKLVPVPELTQYNSGDTRFFFKVNGLSDGTYYLKCSNAGAYAHDYRSFILYDENRETRLLEVPYVLDGKIQVANAADARYAMILVQVPNADIGTAQFEIGSTPTEYAPPSNIRPFIGYDKLDLTAAEKNLCPEYNFTQLTWGNNKPELTNVLNSLPKGTYTISAYFTAVSVPASSDMHGIVIDDVNGKDIGRTQKAWESTVAGTERRISLTVNTTTGIGNVYLYGCGNNSVGTTGSANANRFQIEPGSIASDFHPYAGKLHTVQIGQTVYGLRYEWLTGNGVIEWTAHTFDGTEVFTINESGIAIYTPNEKPLRGTSAIGSHHARVECGNSLNIYDAANATDLSTWTAFITAQNAAGTPVQVAYKLATPIEIQLTPTEIIALSGVNTLYGDGDTITAKFRQSKDVDILKRLSALEALMINQTKGE